MTSCGVFPSGIFPIKLLSILFPPFLYTRSASAYKISPKSDNRSMSYDQKSKFQDGGCRHLEFQKFHFGHVTVTGFNIWCSVPKFIKIWQFFTEIWRFYDFQNGGRPPPWILHICISLSPSPCQHAILLSHTKFCWNRTIGRWFMAKTAIFKMAAAVLLFLMMAAAILNFKHFNFGHVTGTGFNIWCSVPNFIKIGRFFTEIWRFNDFQNGGRPPSCIFKNCSFCHLALVDMPFCFLVQNFAEIGQSAKNAIFKMAAAAILNFKKFSF